MSTLTRVVLAALLVSSWCGEAASLYVVERYRGQVWSFDAASGEGRVVASGLGEMIGVTADRTGRLFVSQFRGFVPASGTVALVDPVSGTFSPIEGTAEVFGLSTDPKSNIL
jgi:sugar lactone lactonase YvrE